jgi:hypothetical protein
MKTTTTPALALALALAAGCGDDPVASLEIAVEYPGPAAEIATGSLHFWVLERPASGEEAIPLGCPELQIGEVTPYDLDIRRHADLVVITEEASIGAATDLPERPALVYVEGVDYVGVPHLAGCEPFDIGSAETVTVALRSRGAFDCGDPATENGAPCDDGTFCTVGESCQSGTCQGGGPRNCTHVADACNGEACSEDIGCRPAPVPNDRPCDDGLFCSAGDTCQDGACASGGDRDCTAVEDDCNVGSCNEEGGACVAIPTNEDLECAILDCDAPGTCSIGTCEPGVEGPVDDETCDDGLDNDCDGDIDLDDADCVL